MGRKKVLWVGDACCDSGYSRVTHKVLESLDYRVRGEFDCTVIGINHRGDDHPYPYPIKCARSGGDQLGVGRLEDVVTSFRPNVVVLLADPFRVPEYMQVLQHAPGLPVVGVLSVNGKNCQGDRLNALAHAIFWTQFGLDEARAGGYGGTASVIPLGVDRDIYRPQDRDEARRRLGLPIPKDAFLVGMVNRNQLRKRFDLAVAYFAEWRHRFGRDDAYLFLHAAPTAERALGIKQWSEYLNRQFPGLRGRVIISEPQPYQGLSEADLATLYCGFDVGWSTSQSEGFGLPLLEMMACGVPTLASDYAAFGEWARDAAMLVPCSVHAVEPTNVVGGVPDREASIEALEMLYSDCGLREILSVKGLSLSRQPQFDWDNIGRAVADDLGRVLADESVPETVGA